MAKETFNDIIWNIYKEISNLPNRADSYIRLTEIDKYYCNIICSVGKTSCKYKENEIKNIDYDIIYF